MPTPPALLAFLDRQHAAAKAPRETPSNIAAVASLAELGETLASLLAGTETPVSLALLRIEAPVALDDLCGIGAAATFGRAAAETVRGMVRRADPVIRFGDDGIAIILQACGADEAKLVTTRLQAGLAQIELPSAVGPLRAAALIGVATRTSSPASADALIQAAADALHDPSDASSEAESSPGQTRLQQRSVAGTILAALEGDGVVLALQPIVDAQTRHLFVFEALARIRDADGALLPPSVTMPVAERTGLIGRIDARVLACAVERLQGEPDLRLSVNLSLRSTRDSGWMDAAESCLRGRRPIAERLIVEITESTAMDDLAATQNLVVRIKALGASVAIDDFGAGHSSFRALRSLPVDLLKLDGAFMRDLPNSPDDRAFVESLVALAHHLHVPIVAEFVEDEATATLLANLSVDYLQGYLIGRPTVGNTPGGRP